MKKLIKKKAAVLFTGGKDSCLALHMALQQGYDVCYLLSVLPKSFDSFMFHKPDLKLLEKQAETLGVKLITQETKGEEERELKDLRLLINEIKKKIDVIVAGGIASSYQGKRIKRICKKMGCEFYAPLWNYKSEDVWNSLFKEKFKVILTKISCEGIGREFLGRIINKRIFNELKKLAEKYKFRLDFEGGEAETAVLFMPEFKKHIYIKYDIKSEGRYRHWLDVLEIK